MVTSTKPYRNGWFKTDVMLAAYGYHMMDVQIVNEVVQDKTFKHPKFYQQLFKLLEDMRVLNSIKVERPSTAKLIDLRLDTRVSYTESQIKVYRTKTQYTDLLFLYLEHAFLSQDFFDIPSIHSDLDDILVNMFLYLPNFSKIKILKIICIWLKELCIK